MSSSSDITWAGAIAGAASSGVVDQGSLESFMIETSSED